MPTLVALIVVAGMQVAPEVRIAGTVRDTTALPLPGATVAVDGRVAAEADDSGAFVLVLPRAVRVAVRISLPGFDPHESTLEAADGQRLDVVLTVAAIEDRVSVAAPRPRERAEPVIAEVQSAGSSRYRLTLRDGRTLIVSRSHALALKHLIL